MSTANHWAPGLHRITDDAVFRALADPSRRALLDHLFKEDGQSLGQLERVLPDMTRFGVMKHLKVLERANLVVTRRRGREKFHYLNQVPIQHLHDRWVSKYTAGRVAALADLKESLEGGTSVQSVVEQVYQIYIRATAEQVWEAITKPEFSARYFYGSRVSTTAEAGAPMLYHAPEGDALWGDAKVIESVRPHRLVHTWRLVYDNEMAAEPPSRVTWELDEDPPGLTKLTVIHDQLEHSPRTAATVSGGWMFILSGLKTVVETGQPLGERSAGRSG